MKYLIIIIFSTFAISQNVESLSKIDSFYIHEILDDDLISDIFIVGGLLYYTSELAIPSNIITTYSIIMISAAIFTKFHARQRIKSIIKKKQKITSNHLKRKDHE